MKTKDFRWLFLAVIVTLMVVGIISEPVHLGASAEWSEDGYRFYGGTALWALIWSALVIGLYVALMAAPSSPLLEPLPGLFRRFIAVFFDLFLAVMMLAPVLGLMPLFTEWKRTGKFQWNFERTIPVASDKVILFVVIFLTFIGLVFYFAIPLVRSRPSPGSCIAGYQVVFRDETQLSMRKAVLRTLLGYVGLCAWFIAPFVNRNKKQGTFWVDKVFGTRAVKLN
jgi:hypothetical protein